MAKHCVLYVEDNADDQILLRHAMERLGAADALWVARDGQEAMQYLEGRGRFCDREVYPVPRLVILDWKLPRVPGGELLRWMRQQPQVSGIPVLVFSYSDFGDDVREAFQGGANGYYLKPSGFQGTVRFASEVVSVLCGTTEPKRGVVTLLVGSEVRGQRSEVRG